MWCVYKVEFKSTVLYFINKILENNVYYLLKYFDKLINNASTFHLASIDTYKKRRT